MELLHAGGNVSTRRQYFVNDIYFARVVAHSLVIFISSSCFSYLYRADFSGLTRICVPRFKCSRWPTAPMEEDKKNSQRPEDDAVNGARCGTENLFSTDDHRNRKTVMNERIQRWPRISAPTARVLKVRQTEQRKLQKPDRRTDCKTLVNLLPPSPHVHLQSPPVRHGNRN